MQGYDCERLPRTENMLCSFDGRFKGFCREPEADTTFLSPVTPFVEPFPTFGSCQTGAASPVRPHALMATERHPQTGYPAASACFCCSVGGLRVRVSFAFSRERECDGALNP